MSSPRYFLLLLALAAMLVIAGCSSGGGGSKPTGGVQGTVLLAPAGGGTQPANGATVRVQHTSLQATTGPDGHYTLAGIPAGARTLLISMNGYAAKSVPVTVKDNVVTPVADVTLVAATRKWTVLVFMNADNDLEMFGVQDLNEMELAPPSDQVATVVQFDRSPGYDTSQGNWTGSRRYLVQHDTDMGTIGSTLLETMGDVDMGNATTLRDFIAWGKAAYPAEHYLLVIWNHGSGWRSRTTAATRGVSFDDTSGTFIRTVDLPSALATDVPFDLIAWDASLMQMLEIAYQIRNNADYLVGSEESPPGEGYHYVDWLTPLVNNPSMTAAQLGALIGQVTLNYYGAGSDITQSLIKTSELPALASAVDSFAASLIAHADSEKAALATARDTAEAFKFSEYKDLQHYAMLVKQHAASATLRASADVLIAQVSRAVLANYHGSAHPNAYGISIFIPVPSAYPAWMQSMYVPLAFSQNTRWDDWLKAQAQ